MTRLPIALVVSLVLVVAAFIPGQVFRIKAITCSTEQGPCNPELVQSLSHLVGQPLYFTTFPTILSHPGIKSVEFFRHPPSALEVKIILRRPLGSIYTPEDPGRIWQVDDGGYVTEPIDQTSLPQLQIPNVPPLGRQVNPAQLQALQLLSRPVWSNLGFGQPTARLVSSSLHIFFPSGTEVIVFANQVETGWERALQAVVQGSKITDRLPRIIDLRYKNPIVSYGQE